MDFIAKLQLRYNDFDGQKIINNAVIFSLLENSQLLFFEQLVGSRWDWSCVPLVLSKINVVFVKQIQSKEPLHGRVLVKEVEDYFVVLKIYLESPRSEVYSIGELKLVHYDFTKQEKVMWDEALYTNLKKYIE
ncbi:MAG: hypothetical protein NT040_10530 [Bacteroidetes bacterium]|nr:hypothetical protein [Bacteroidota bacterium]